MSRSLIPVPWKKPEATLSGPIQQRRCQALERAAISRFPVVRVAVLLRLGAAGGAAPGSGTSVRTVLPSVLRHVRGLQAVQLRCVPNAARVLWVGQVDETNGP